ncbi:AraC family transcriptional regulator [Anaerocolumna sp. AGMB13025]|uniref:AraC family transcriptional regulator n=1 Tax=Anaerocolumna sp. AGMB13025 TaxID=3039116 RepID=UPI00241F95C8|nr:AraC family transcriptional regulator [Anaerocolumna sp. AGMB13025]WFR54912.1 AraC family transcriptional regulator [Anaerocolumna sp. AGMB13025]
MNYSKDMERCIDYVEEHIKDNLTAETIALAMGYSVYHFCRVFCICKGIPLMEYVRKRKLSLSSTELFQGKKIIDIALEYGFETPGGYAKAFRKEFHFSPTQYAARMAGFLELKSDQNIGGYMMKPVIMKKAAFKAAGYGIKTNVTGSSYTKDIASFWSYYEGENLESKLYQILNPETHGEVGLCIPSPEDGTLTYLLGVIVTDFENVTEDMLTIEVPEAEYAVFTTPPVDTTMDTDQDEFAAIIKSTWKYIFTEWFTDSGYIYDETKLDFEYYDERCHQRLDTVMEIYVPVKKINAK